MPPGSSTMSMSFPPFTRAVKELLIANGVVFLLFWFLRAFTATAPFGDWAYVHLGLEGAAVVHGEIWQLVTYSFLHYGVLHILFNMLALWMFGAQLEQDWGYSLFMQFYFFCVMGAALVTVAVSFTGLLGVSPQTLTVGASGGIYGLLLAFGILHGESQVMLFPLPFLIKAKYFVIGIIALAMYGALSSAQGGGQSIAYMAHLGGALFGYIWLKFIPRRGFGYAASDCATPITAGSASAPRASSRSICASTIAATTGTMTTSTSTATSAIPAPAMCARKTATPPRRG